MEQMILDPGRLQMAAFSRVIVNRTAASSITAPAQNTGFGLMAALQDTGTRAGFPAFYFKIAQDERRLLVP